MSKIDPNLLSILHNQSDVATLADKRVSAVIRVRNPLHFNILERHFDIVKLYPFISSVVIKLGIKEAIELERIKEVEYVSATSRVFTLNDISSTIDNDDYQIKQSVISNCDNRLTGEGVTLCVMDTGVTPHIDICVPKDRVIFFKDFVGEGEYAYDDNGHGTFVSGVAIGNGNLSGKRIVGVAPKSNLVSLKVIEKNGESSSLTILDGMQWLFDNYKKYDIKVVCMSFGADPLPYGDPLKIGVEMLSRSGIVCVVAAGNSGVGTIKSPAISSEVISVGAIDDNLNIAKFSSRGNYHNCERPDVYAKGVDVVSLQAGGTYCKMSGTSSSTPYVAGACCLLLERNKALSPLQTKNILLNNCIAHNGIRILK